MRQRKTKMTTRRAGLLLAAVSLWAAASPLASGENPKKKLPVPSEAAQAEAMKVVKEVYGEQYAKADSQAAKQALGATLLEKGKETRDDPAGRFVLLRLSREVATQGLDGLTAFARWTRSPRPSRSIRWK